QIIEAEYRVVIEPEPAVEKAGAAAPTVKPQLKAKAQAKTETPPVAEEAPPDGAIEGEGFHIDLTWLKESQKALKWTDDTMKTFLVSKYKVSPQGTLTEVLSRLAREQAEEFVKEINKRVEKQASLF
ncbi:MAG: hypothetical protein Q7J06_08765, partial [Bacteroidales bacterium]|nr:hypothetical protein [Bacteroidales bacterium]